MEFICGPPVKNIQTEQTLNETRIKQEAGDTGWQHDEQENALRQETCSENQGTYNYFGATQPTGHPENETYNSRKQTPDTGRQQNEEKDVPIDETCGVDGTGSDGEVLPQVAVQSQTVQEGSHAAEPTYICWKCGYQDAHKEMAELICEPPVKKLHVEPTANETRIKEEETGDTGWQQTHIKEEETGDTGWQQTHIKEETGDTAWQQTHIKEETGNTAWQQTHIEEEETGDTGWQQTHIKEEETGDTAWQQTHIKEETGNTAWQQTHIKAEETGDAAWQQDEHENVLCQDTYDKDQETYDFFGTTLPTGHPCDETYNSWEQTADTGRQQGGEKDVPNDETVGSDHNQLMTNVAINSDGFMTWMAPRIFASSCKIDIYYFPFDEQECTLEFGSWTYGGFDVNTTTEDAPPSLTYFVHNDEWELINITGVQDDIYYPCCPEPYPLVTFTIHVQRR
ncbi:CHRNA7 [Branchiostoma lanceolatum]|uniref:CHRNA7 protein n=1 Tax=Branchiostoma lanceolatum TaxID=7740 RepID=A0A8J9VK48_BRALA|nr:CHRNA7 [Branchiostoma lanceolatum]